MATTIDTNEIIARARIASASMVFMCCAPLSAHSFSSVSAPERVLQSDHWQRRQRMASDPIESQRD